MPDARPLTGLYGKVPAHGDFVRRALPSSFVTPWDSWLQAAVAAAREALGPRWEDAWDAAPAWRFALPPGACGPDGVAGVMLPSADTVGRRFPVTLAALLAPGQPVPQDAWFDHVEAAAMAGRAGAADADALAAAIPVPGAPPEGFPPPLAATMAAAWSAPPPAVDPLPAIPPAAPFWAATDRAAPAEGDDVLAIFAAGPANGPGAAPPSPDDAGSPLPETGSTVPEAALPPLPAAPSGDTALAGAEGGAAAPAEDALSLLIGAAAAGPAAIPLQPGLPGGDADPLALLIGQASAGSGDAIAPGAGADPLAGLIGAGAADGPDAFAPPPAAAEPPDPLAALIGAGAAAGLATDTADLLAATPAPLDPADPPGDAALESGLAAPAGAAPGDVFAPFALEPVDGPDAAAGDLIAPAAPLPAAPPAPEGGGWWTRGAARLPAMVWALPALPAPSDFACLLEADA